MKYKIYITVLFLAVFNLIYSQNKSNCNMIVVDELTKEVLVNSRVYVKTHEILPEIPKNGIFIIPCDYKDSLYVISAGYEDQLLFNQRDTVYLKSNQIDLEEITIVALKKKSKYFLIGSKNRNCDFNTSFGFDYFQNQKMITLFPNKLKKEVQIEEGYIFLRFNDTIAPNLILTFYENEEGKIGKELSKNIKVFKGDKKNGWYQLNLMKEKIKIPKKGLIISIQNLSNKSNSVYLGLTEFKEDLGIKTYIFKDDNWSEFPIIENENERKHYGVKFYFKVK